MDLCEPHRELGLTLPRKSYGIRSLHAAERIRLRSKRVRRIRPRAAWNRGKKKLKLPPSRELSLSLSRRQSELLSLLAKGLSNIEMATALGISERAIKFHLSNLYKKSATQNRMNLLLWHLRKVGTLAPAASENSASENALEKSEKALPYTKRSA